MEAHYLSQHQLEVLAQHTYKCDGKSMLDPLLQPYWEWLVGKFPTWMAPNLITLLGIIINIFTGLIIICYDPGFNADIPRWPYFIFGIGLFIYQSMDAIDGKQARRTKQSSPLGELFDHGCDSISALFLLAASLSCMNAGKLHVFVFWHIFSVMFLFFSYQWRTYVTGKFRFASIDVTEIQTLCVIMFVVRGFVGHDLFYFTLVPGYSVLDAINVFSIMFECYVILRTLIPILNEGVGKNGTTVAGTSVLSPAIPMAIIILFAVVYIRESKVGAFNLNPSLIAFAFALPISKYSILIVLSHICKSPLPLLDSIMWGPFLVLVNLYFGVVIDESIALWLCLAYVIVNLLYTANLISSDICNYLHINCFTISATNSS